MTNDLHISVVELIARLNIGGPAVLVLDLAAGLAGDDFKVEVAAGQVGQGEADMDFWADARNVSWTHVPGLSPELGAGNLTALKAIGSLLKEQRPHILHTHTAKAGTLGRSAAIKAGIFGRRRPGLVHTFHGHIFRGYFPPWKTRLFISVERFLARFTDRVVVLSPEQAKDIGRVFRICAPEKIRIIPVGLELAPFARTTSSDLRERLGIDPDNFIVGSIGRITGIKDHATLLQGLAQAAEDLPRPLTLVVVGQGELEEQTKAQAASLGLDVRFMGWQPGTVDLLPGFDLVALTSLNEGLPLVLIEALAAGRPVVSTPVGGVPSLLNMGKEPSKANFSPAERGLFFPVGDPAGLAKAVSWAADHPGQALEMGRAGQKHVLAHHNQEAYVRAHAELYRELFRERHG